MSNMLYVFQDMYVYIDRSDNNKIKMRTITFQLCLRLRTIDMSFGVTQQLCILCDKLYLC